MNVNDYWALVVKDIYESLPFKKVEDEQAMYQAIANKALKSNYLWGVIEDYIGKEINRYIKKGGCK